MTDWLSYLRFCNPPSLQQAAVQSCLKAKNFVSCFVVLRLPKPNPRSHKNAQCPIVGYMLHSTFLQSGRSTSKMLKGWEKVSTCTFSLFKSAHAEMLQNSDLECEHPRVWELFGTGAAFALGPIPADTPPKHETQTVRTPPHKHVTLNHGEFPGSAHWSHKAWILPPAVANT